MLRRLRRILLIVLLLAGGAVFVYMRAFRPVPVQAHEVAVETLVVEVMGTGSVEARTSTIVSSRIQGRLVSLAVDEGDRVESRAIIAHLDDSDLARQVELAQATLEVTQAGLDRLKADGARAQAAHRLAEREDRRTRDAFNKGAATETEIDRSAQALAIAEAEVARSEAAIAEGRKLIIASTKSLEYRQALLADTAIEAPFDGLIVRRDRDPGDVVVPGSSIYRIVATDEIWVSAWIDETAMAALAPDQPARIVLRSEPDHPYPGHVVRLGRETDTETREFIVDVAMEQLPEHWAIGQRAEAFVETERLEAVLVAPLTFVFVVDGSRGVFVRQNGRAVWTPCEFGSRERERVEVRAGLKAGDILVRPADVDGRDLLRDGRRVAVQ